MQGSISPTSEVASVPHQDGHSHGHKDLRPFGLIVFLISEGMLFMGLFVAYLTYRAVAPSWPPEGTPELELLLPGVNTLILLSSSFVIHQADTAIKENRLAATRGWFLATFVMGAIFLSGQIYEYQHLSFGLTDSLFGSTFYVLTGFHGLHVLIGLCLIGAVLIRSFTPNRYSDKYHFGIEAASIYWHFVDIIWVILFGLLYLL
ncbi:MAG: heme-copper oxidase subunit III [Pseudanabaena sp. ELA607]